MASTAVQSYNRKKGGGANSNPSMFGGQKGQDRSGRATASAKRAQVTAIVTKPHSPGPPIEIGGALVPALAPTPLAGIANASLGGRYKARRGSYFANPGSDGDLVGKKSGSSPGASTAMLEKRCILKPTDNFMGYWDSYIFFLLLFTAAVTPYEVAFLETDPCTVLFYINRIVDVSFITVSSVSCSSVRWLNPVSPRNSHRFFPSARASEVGGSVSASREKRLLDMLGSFPHPTNAPRVGFISATG